MKGRSVPVVFAVFIAAAGAAAIGNAQSPAPSASAAAAPLAQVAYLKASNTEAGDHFACGGALDGHAGIGAAISGDGNTIAISAPHESSGAAGINGNQNDNSLYNSGAVYVFARDGGAWSQQAYVKASDPGLNDQFGHVVALSGDGNTMAVSAVFEASAATDINGDQNDDSIPGAGAVYVFTRSGGTWSQQAYIKASNTGEAGVGDEFGDGDQFGFSVALSDDGNTLAVGAIAEDSAASGINGDQADNSAMSAGAVYVFSRTGTTWSQQAYVKAGNTQQGSYFGYSVSLNADGNMLAVGHYDERGCSKVINGPYEPANCNGYGAVYVFRRTGGAWAQQAYLKASNAENGDSLGVSVALNDDGTTLAAGAFDADWLGTGIIHGPTEEGGNDRASDTSSGAAYVFVRNGETWTQQAYLKASNTGEHDWFGAKLAISGDGNTVAVSAPLEDSSAQGINGRQDDDSASESGAVYFFRRTGSTWSQLAYVKGSNTEAFDEFGSSVALSRDGGTMVVGALGEDSAATGVNGNQADNSAMDAGAAYVFSAPSF